MRLYSSAIMLIVSLSIHPIQRVSANPLSVTFGLFVDGMGPLHVSICHRLTYRCLRHTSIQSSLNLPPAPVGRSSPPVPPYSGHRSGKQIISPVRSLTDDVRKFRIDRRWEASLSRRLCFFVAFFAAVFFCLLRHFYFYHHLFFIIFAGVLPLRCFSSSQTKP